MNEPIYFLFSDMLSIIYLTIYFLLSSSYMFLLDAHNALKVDILHFQPGEQQHKDFTALNLIRLQDSALYYEKRTVLG